MQFWNKLSEQQPDCFKSGDFDGLKSEKLFFADTTGNVYVGECYQGVVYGIEFCDFVDQYDNQILDVTLWAEIPLFPA